MRAPRVPAIVGALALMIAVVAATAAPTVVAAPSNGANWVVVPYGQPVQIAFTADTTEDPIFTSASTSVGHAIQMAIERHGSIHGFKVRVNTVETTCLATDNTATAAAIVGNAQNTAVLGHLCSGGEATALPIYEAAGLVAISGSATTSTLPALAPTVFDRMAVVSDSAGDAGDLWLARVAALPAVQLWAKRYKAEFAADPYLQPIPALFYDATALLLTRLQQVSRVVGGNLVISRRALAWAVRHTTGLPGVTCTITLDPATGNRIDDEASLAACARM
jgi:ABC-type branched-subunit amino acid transport system substrate-binding protein